MARETLTHISQNPDERARFRSRRIWQQDREHEQAVWAGEVMAVRAALEPLIAEKDSIIAGNNAMLADKDATIADKDAMIADKDAEIQSLKSQLEAASATLKSI